MAVRAYRTSPPQADADSSAAEAVEQLFNATLVEGTGVVIDRQGLILTNHHVVRGADDLDAWVAGHGWLPARLVAADSLYDLAVIAVHPGAPGLPDAARFSAPRADEVGGALVALGFTPGEPPDAGPTTLSGRLTSCHRSLQSALDPARSRYYGDLLECTIPLKPGHSGGPLIDGTGGVVGLNTAAVIRHSTGQRIGYAIPMSGHVQSVIARLARGETVVHGYLGLFVCTCDNRGLGVVAVDVRPDSPAAASGVRRGDVILGIDGTPVGSAAHLAELVSRSSPGRDLAMTVRRDGRVHDLAVRPGLRP